MVKKVLIVGGAGFIGSHLADALLSRGHQVRVLDSLEPQVHGEGAASGSQPEEAVELLVGDVRDSQTVARALSGIEVVVHLAAAVGVGQSMYEIARYSSINAYGTAVLLEAIAKHPVERLIVASSMSIYGEGLYRDGQGALIGDARRERAALQAHRWELRDLSGQRLAPLPTPESKPPQPDSVYALLKYHQERMCLCVGAAYAMPTIALRFFNTFGPRQALSNPYTGVLAIFAARLLNDQPPLIYEDGLQQRDFVSVHDVAQACCLAVEKPGLGAGVFNIGSGQPITIRALAERLATVLGKQHLVPLNFGQYRVGDIRHCFADIARARELLGYQPAVSLESGLAELAQWVRTQPAQDRVDRVVAAGAELTARGLAL